MRRKRRGRLSFRPTSATLFARVRLPPRRYLSAVAAASRTQGPARYVPLLPLGDFFLPPNCTVLASPCLSHAVCSKKKTFTDNGGLATIFAKQLFFPKKVTVSQVRSTTLAEWRSLVHTIVKTNHFENTVFCPTLQHQEKRGF